MECSVELALTIRSGSSVGCSTEGERWFRPSMSFDTVLRCSCGSSCGCMASGSCPGVDFIKVNGTSVSCSFAATEDSAYPLDLSTQGPRVRVRNSTVYSSDNMDDSRSNTSFHSLMSPPELAFSVFAFFFSILS